MKEELCRLEAQALRAIESAGDTANLTQLRVRYMGKKGELTALLKQMGRLPAGERPAMGQVVNAARERLEAAFAEAEARLSAAEQGERMAGEAIDVTLPGAGRTAGALHPLSLALGELLDTFVGLGFEVV